MKFFSDDPLTGTTFEHVAMAGWFLGWYIVLMLVIVGVIG